MSRGTSVDATPEAARSPRDPRRDVPSLDALLRSGPARKAAQKLGRHVVKHALQSALADSRRRSEGGEAVPDQDDILARAIASAGRTFYGLNEVINATGVLLHTGLGRAPLPERAALAAARAARGYSDLEIDAETGGRGRRTARAETLLAAMTGAEGALVVNNNAAALMLALAELARGREVLVSRGELIEIGGEFRLPDIMAASGAKLIEVGTTNRTRVGDYRRGIGRRTSLILKVHPSNYRVIGFAHAVDLGALSAIARQAKLPLLYDVGSGLLERYPEVPAEEPTVVEALAGGADLVAFSGDKLLGGPQAGLIVGRADLIDRLRSHPMARAMRVDKMTVAALEAVLRLYATGRRLELPLWRLLSAKQSSLLSRARALASVFGGASARESEAVAGGGSLPGYGIPSAELVLPVPSPDRTAARLRRGRPSVLCRIDDGVLLFDLRTVPAEGDDGLLRAIRYALEQG